MKKSLCILLGMVLLLSMAACGRDKQPQNYVNTKAAALELFSDKKEEFLFVVTEFEKSGVIDFAIDGVSSISCKEVGDDKCIEFLIGSKGMLGGQYWCLSYHSGNAPYISWGYSWNELTSGPYLGSYFWQENPSEGKQLFCH